jgi:hypothetical protein
MNNPIKTIIRFFWQPRHNITTRRFQPEQPPNDFCNLPPGNIPIETLYEGQEIPGTSHYVGNIAKIFQTMSGEQVTYDQKKGVRCGCQHNIFSIDEKVTPTGIQRGLGGTCVYCAAEAAELFKLNLISQQQAEQLSLYCSQCASHCDGCRRTDICRRHAQKFEDVDGKTILLCPACLKKANNEKIFNKTLAMLLLPFVEHKRKPPK